MSGLGRVGGFLVSSMHFLWVFCSSSCLVLDILLSGTPVFRVLVLFYHSISLGVQVSRLRNVSAARDVGMFRVYKFRSFAL